MPKQGVQLKQLSSLPATWLTEGRLKLSLLLRHETNRTDRGPEALKYLLQEKSSPNSVFSAFPDLREPNQDLLERASDDYLRCLLAKSIAEVFKKVTPKYRNEAARRQFFKRLVEIVDAIHLSESPERLHELIGPSESDDARSWVSFELERMFAGRADLVAEHNAKLNSARVEFRGVLRQLEEIVGQTWQESERFRGSIAIASFFPPRVVEKEDTWRWGTQWHPEAGVLNINPPVLLLDTLRKGVLAREAAILLSPRVLDTLEPAPRMMCEQSEYLAYKMIDRKNDKELWSEARHGLRQQTRFRGHELIDFFHYYEMMVGDSLYSDVWSRLKEFGTVRLTAADYNLILNTLAGRPIHLRFQKDELRLLDLLSKNPNVRAGEAARLLRVSVPTAMKAIRELSKEAGLRFTVVVDMKKIGLIEYLLLINTGKQSEVLRILSRFPYCRQVFRTYGAFDLFCVFDIPEEHADFPREFLERLVEKKLVRSHRLLELVRDFQSVNFDHYNTALSRWDIHWDTWGVSLRESLSKNESAFLDSSASGQRHRFQFDVLDMDILSELQNNCRMPFSTIGRTLGVSGAYVGKKITKMVRERVFRYSIWPLKIGAEDWGLVGLSCSNQTAATLASYLSILPAWRGGLAIGDFEGILAIVWCPSGELKQLFKAIDDRLVKTNRAQAECLGSVGEWVIARWLPVDPYPERLCGDNGNWIFNENKYYSLIA